MPLFITAILGLVAVACSQPTSPGDTATFADANPRDVDPALQTLASALAYSLTSDSLREGLSRAFRLSSLPEHKVILDGYLRDDPILRARLYQYMPDTAAISELRQLELWIPGAIHRQNWLGDDQAIVVALDRGALADPHVAVSPVLGFRFGGDTVIVYPFEWISEPLIVLMPADSTIAFRYDPPPLAGTMHTEPEQGLAGTIGTPESTWDLLRARGRYFEEDQILVPPELIGTDAAQLLEEAATMLDEELQLQMETTLRVNESAGGAGREDGEVGYRLGEDWSFDECRISSGRAFTHPAADADGDDLIDECEFQAASRFAPVLMFDEEEDGIDRETYWAVRVEDKAKRRLAIFYALGYYRDTGPAKAHVGDSEFIVVVVRYTDDSRWATEEVVASAHYGVQFPLYADRTVLTESPVWADTVGGRAVIWVSRGKHANYHSRRTCNGGHINLFFKTLSSLPGVGRLLPSRWKQGLDYCGYNPMEDPVTVQREGNLGGDGMVLVNCTWSQARPAQSGMECLWDRHGKFSGWSGESEGVTPYGSLLARHGFEP